MDSTSPSPSNIETFNHTKVLTSSLMMNKTLNQTATNSSSSTNDFYTSLNSQICSSASATTLLAALNSNPQLLFQSNSNTKKPTSNSDILLSKLKPELSTSDIEFDQHNPDDEYDDNEDEDDDDENSFYDNSTLLAGTDLHSNLDSNNYGETNKDTFSLIFNNNFDNDSLDNIIIKSYISSSNTPTNRRNHDVLNNNNNTSRNDLIIDNNNKLLSGSNFVRLSDHCDMDDMDEDDLDNDFELGNNSSNNYLDNVILTTAAANDETLPQLVLTNQILNNDENDENFFTANNLTASSNVQASSSGSSSASSSGLHSIPVINTEPELKNINTSLLNSTNPSGDILNQKKRKKYKRIQL